MTQICTYPPPEDCGPFRWLGPHALRWQPNHHFRGTTKIETAYYGTNGHQTTASRGAHPWTITFAFVATHNHFVLDRGGKVFNRIRTGNQVTGGSKRGGASAPTRTAQQFHRLLLAQDGEPRQRNTRRGRRIYQHRSWERFFEFTGTKLQEFPIPHSFRLPSYRPNSNYSLDDLSRHPPHQYAGRGNRRPPAVRRKKRMAQLARQNDFTARRNGLASLFDIQLIFRTAMDHRQ